MRVHVLTIALTALLVASLYAGYVRLTGEVYRQVQDPGLFVQVAAVDGAAVTLESGEELQVFALLRRAFTVSR